jgi:hypothetical protein
LDYPLSAAQRLFQDRQILGTHLVIDLDQPWDPDRFARVWRGILADHPILRSEVDAPAGIVRELDQAAWGGSGIVHVDLSERGPMAARHAIDHLAFAASPFNDPSRHDSPTLTHRVTTVERPGGGFTVIVPVSRLAFDVESREVLARRVVDGYAAGGPGMPDRRPYGDYLRFAALGPADVDDDHVVRELDLERFAAAVDAFPAQQPSETVDVEHDLSPDAPPEAVERLIAEALGHGFGLDAVPLLLAVPGRHYRDGNFAGYIGQFGDFLPIVADPQTPGILATARWQLDYLRKHNLPVSSLLADPLMASRLPRAVELVGRAGIGRIPVLNLVPPPPVGSLVVDADPWSGPGDALVINVLRTDECLVLQGLPSQGNQLSGLIAEAEPGAE